MKFLPFVTALIITTSSAAAEIDCSPLKPEPPKNTNQSFNGKIDVAVDGLFAKLASVGTKVEGSYTEISNSILKEFPDADKLYMWERVLFLQCQVIGSSGDLTGNEKLKSVVELYGKIGAPPPTVPNTMNNSGDHVIMQQGDRNKAEVK